MRAFAIPWWRMLLVIGALLLLLLPFVFLLVAGVVWLYSQGWLLWWLVSATCAAGLVFVVTKWRRRRSAARLTAEPEAEGATITSPDPLWSPREHEAWRAVAQISAQADSTTLAERDRMLDVARATLEAVARCYHPGREDPLLEFTMPELLLLTENVSRRMRRLLIDHVPFSDRISARHLAVAWGYRPAMQRAVSHGRKAYALLRVVRAVNPFNALLAELRDRVIDELYSDFNSKVRTRIVRLWIEDVGRAAIDLYSGRLRLDTDELAEHAAGDAQGSDAQQQALPGALRLLIVGRTKAGKSTAINALLGDLAAGVDVLPLTAGYVGYELREDGAPAVALIDSPGLDDETQLDELVSQARLSDLIVWVVAAHRADRRLDRLALDALREAWQRDPSLRMPPVIVVASHIDRLSPLREWEPPYNVDAPDGSKAGSIRAALDSIAEDLAVPSHAIVPVRLDGPQPYNLDLLQLRLADAFDDAQRTRWVRIHGDAVRRRDWRKLMRQLAGSGRMVGTLVRRQQDP